MTKKYPEDKVEKRIIYFLSKGKHTPTTLITLFIGSTHHNRVKETLNRMEKEGKLHCIKTGRFTFWDLKEVELPRVEASSGKVEVKV